MIWRGWGESLPRPLVLNIIEGNRCAVLCRPRASVLGEPGFNCIVEVFIMWVFPEFAGVCHIEGHFPKRCE